MKTVILILTIAVTVINAGVRKSYVIPVKNNVGVYQNRTRKLFERSLFTLTPNDRCIVMGEKERSIKIQDSQGRVGWVKRRLVKPVGPNATFVFDTTSVMGYLNNPTPIYILLSERDEYTRLRLDRSFSEELSVNVDRETIARSAK